MLAVAPVKGRPLAFRIDNHQEFVALLYSQTYVFTQMSGRYQIKSDVRILWLLSSQSCF